MATNLVKGLSMRQKLQNSKGYAESPGFLPALGLFNFKKKSVATTCKVNFDDYASILLFVINIH